MFLCRQDVRGTFTAAGGKVEGDLDFFVKAWADSTVLLLGGAWGLPAAGARARSGLAVL